MHYTASLGGKAYRFPDLRTLLARASPLRSADELAGLAAGSEEERAVAQQVLADVPLRQFLEEPLIDPEIDEVSRLILQSHSQDAFAPLASHNVGEFREWLLSEGATTGGTGRGAFRHHAGDGRGGLQDHAQPGPDRGRADAVRVTTRFRNTIGLPGRLSTRLQPNHPDRRPRAASPPACWTGCSTAAATRSSASTRPPTARRTWTRLLDLLDDIIGSATKSPPSPACWPTSPPLWQLMRRGAPVDLVFQSIAGTEAANRSFGINLALLAEARDTALALGRGTLGDNVMYFETGQGSALSADAHHGVDQQTCEARAYAVARAFSPAAGQHGRRLHRAGVPVRRQTDHPRRAGGPLLRQAAGPADGRATSATPTTPRPTRTTWTTC